MCIGGHVWSPFVVALSLHRQLYMHCPLNPDLSQIAQEPTLVLKAIDSRDPTTVELFYTFLRKTFPAEKVSHLYFDASAGRVAFVEMDLV